MEELIIKEPKVENLIYEIRGKQVMLDADLAKLYQVETKRINEAVKRNPERFPEDFYFQLTKWEYGRLRSQNATANRGSMSRNLPYAFTEQGVSMLSSVLKSEIAARVSVNIMRAFVAMRHYISSNLIEQKYVNDLVFKDHDRINLLEASFDQFQEKRKSHEIYFNGQIFDAYSKILEIFKEAKNELIIIDSYADKTTLDIIKNLDNSNDSGDNIKVTIITSETNKYLTKQTIDKYNEQYSNLELKYNNTFHDRYFILDGKIVYHCGASINRIGYKTFSITKIQDEEMVETLLNKIDKI